MSCSPCLIPGPANGPRTVFVVCADFTIGRSDVDVNSLAAGVKITLPPSPRVGEFTKISATAGDVSVFGGAWPVEGLPAGAPFVVPNGRTFRFTFTAAHTWIALQ